MMTGISVVLLICLVGLSGTLSASETALFSLSPMKVHSFRRSSDPGKKSAGLLLSSPRKLLVTILMLNVLVNILVQNVVSSIFGTLSGYLVTVILPLALVLIFGEVIPKSIAIAKNEAIARKISFFLKAAEKIVKPVRDLIVTITSPLSRFIFFFLKPQKNVSVDELKHALLTSRQSGILNQEEARLIRGYLNLEEHVLKEVMRPRGDVKVYDIDDPIEELFYCFTDLELSRIPVVKGDLENLLGIIDSQTFFLIKDTVKKGSDLQSHLKKPEFVPEAMESRKLLEIFTQNKDEIFFVVDEYGSISGIATIEDLVEVVLGQIVDKHDTHSLFTRSGKDVIICSGKLELMDLEDLFEVKLESPNNMATVGGWLTEYFGDIPKSGTKITTEHFIFHVLSADHNRIRRLYVRRLKSHHEDEGSQ